MQNAAIVDLQEKTLLYVVSLLLFRNDGIKHYEKDVQVMIM